MRTTECQKALEQVTAYLDDPAEHQAKAEAAMEHIETCSHCQNNLGYLTRAIATPVLDQLTCEECQKRLPEYMQTDIAGQPDLNRWRAVAPHLANCPRCAAVYADLTDMLALANRERGLEPEKYPAPRLLFLAREPASPQQVRQIPWRLDQFGRLVVELTTELVRAIQPPAFQPAYATAQKAESAALLLRLTLADALEDLAVTITAEPVRGAAALCVVITQIVIPSRGGWPNLAGSEVTLKRDQAEIGTQVTDAFGNAVFQEILTDDLARLRFEIKPNRS
jgi:hypothetical protein